MLFVLRIPRQEASSQGERLRLGLLHGGLGSGLTVGTEFLAVFIDSEGNKQHNNQNADRRQQNFVKEPVHALDLVNAFFLLLGVFQLLTPLSYTDRIILT